MRGFLYTKKHWFENQSALSYYEPPALRGETFSNAMADRAVPAISRTLSGVISGWIRFSEAAPERRPCVRAEETAVPLRYMVPFGMH